MRRFEFLQAPHQRVVFGVGDLRLIENVVEVFVTAKLFAEPFDFARGIFHAHLIYNLTSDAGGNTSQATGIPFSFTILARVN